MNWNDYRKAVDAIPFSADFQERTEELVHRTAQTTELEKEYSTMKKRGFFRVLAAAAAVAMLTVSAYAASRWLSPAQVADRTGNPALAQAFEDRNAIRVGQTVETEGLAVTLAGLVSGEKLTSWTKYAEDSRTYAVMILESLDETPLDTQSFDFSQYTCTPLVAGFTPWSVNNWTLNANATGFAQDGAFYYLLDVQSLEMFADHTVYLAFYEGLLPNRDTFTMAEDGSISFAEDFEGPHALFTLPLDAGKADPAAVDAFIEASGFDREWFTTVEPDDGKTCDVQTVETETEDGVHIEILPGDGSGSGNQS